MNERRLWSHSPFVEGPPQDATMVGVRMSSWRAVGWAQRQLPLLWLIESLMDQSMTSPALVRWASRQQLGWLMLPSTFLRSVPLPKQA